MEWYQRIRALREDADITQETVAVYLKIKQSYYSGYERNKHELPIRHIINLSELYGVTTDYLLCRTDKPNEGISIRKAIILQRDNNHNTFNL